MMNCIGQTLMVQGTSSSVGKSLLVAALCRMFARRGVRVAPFKAQNMSNNAAVCADGSEIGRSQALQAAAAGVLPTAAMNPILLKPEADSRSQVIVNGRPWRTLDARAYYRHREELWPVVTAALDGLRREHDLVIIEGAGSPAELNLRGNDIVNMAVARYCDAPVLLAGDIDRGGIFAQLLGTLWLLDEDDRRLVHGFIVNKFRGDMSLFDAGTEILEERGGVPVLGVVPWLADLCLPEEDGQPLDDVLSSKPRANELDIAVVRLPRISNFDDFDPLANEPGISLRYVSSASQLGSPAAVILPGTKSTIADLHWLRETGLAERIVKLSRTEATVIGICGGYQMLGMTIRDPDGIESSTPEVAGLGLLPVQTAFSRTKETHQVRAIINDDRHAPGCRGAEMTGYEIHLGQTTGVRRWLTVTERSDGAVSILDGAVSDDGRIWGTYLHGLFANDAFRHAFVHSLRPECLPLRAPPTNKIDPLQAALDRLADTVENAIDMSLLEQIIHAGKEREPCPM